MRFDSLLEPLVLRARTEPDFVSVVVVDGADRVNVTAARFVAEAAARAAALRAAGVGADDVVVLALDHSAELLWWIFGAFHRGAAVTVFPYPSPLTPSERYVQRLARLAADAGARAVIADPSTAARLGAASPSGFAIVRGDAPCEPSEDAPEPYRADALAVIQYTSGTTGLSKGVRLTHRAVLESVRITSLGLNLTREDVVVNWLPLYHDFGLVAGFLMPLTMGTRLVLMSPFQFARNPKSYLQVVHEQKGTVSFLPNFALNHSVRNVRPSDIAGVDLTSLRTVVAGAEPTRHESQEAFVRKFQPFGFDENALCVGYGMAENTLTATLTVSGVRPPVDWVSGPLLRERGLATECAAGGAVPVVSCGLPLSGVEIRVVGDDGTPLPDRAVGAIRLRSGSLFEGYHKRPDLTSSTLRDGWLETGDLGYFADGQLYVVGRSKDVIIVDGKNVYPQDVEALAAGAQGLYEGHAVAFGVTSERAGSERIVLVCEARPTLAVEDRHALEQTLRQRALDELGVPLGAVVFARKGWIVKTHNGKLSRSANRDKYEVERHASDAAQCEDTRAVPIRSGGAQAPPHAS
jgi:acyl-CoA synthetase (AMP-forming)/AMP-acid ligase II